MSGTGPLTGGQAVLRFLEARGGERVFGLPGSSSVPIFHELPDAKVSFVPSLQEGSALAMADGYARIAGPTGVLLYMVPGLATAMSNLYNAHRDDTPLLVVASQQSSRARWGQGSVGEADLVEIAQPFTRFAREVTHPSQLVEVLEAAHRATAGPPGGPALVVVPEDLLRTEVAMPAAFPARIRDRAAPHELGELVGHLVAAERPVIIVGGQLRRAGGSAAVEALADELEVPVLYEPFWNDRLGVAPGHRCALGQLTEGSSLVATADLVLAIGCRLFNEVHPRTDPWFAPGAFVAHVNANAGAVESTRPTSWSSTADPGVAAEALLEASRARGLDPGVRSARRARLEAAAERRRRPRPGPFAEAAGALADALDRGYLVDESVSASQPLLSALRGARGDRYVSTTGGSLGWGIGAACGVALATEAPVTCVLGDGAFFFGVQGLWPAVALDLPITFVVLDNGGFASTRWFENRYVADRNGPAGVPMFVGADFGAHGPSVVDVARGFGIAAATVPAGGLAARLTSRSGHTGPALVHVPIDPADGSDGPRALRAG